MIFGELRRISKSHSHCVLVSHHTTIDPTNPYAKAVMTGGKNIIHNFKVVLYVQKSKSPNIEKMTVRKLYLMRFFNKQGWKDFRKIKLTSDGFIFAPEEDDVSERTTTDQ